jgi:hypothetical protein
MTSWRDPSSREEALPPEIFLPLAIAVIVLMQGFFFVRAITAQSAVTFLGTHSRIERPAAYWFWRIYYYVGLVVVFAVAIAIPIGLLSS